MLLWGHCQACQTPISVLIELHSVQCCVCRGMHFDLCLFVAENAFVAYVVCCREVHTDSGPA